MLGDQEFQRLSDESISALYDKLAEASNDYEFDVDMNGGALTVEFEEPPERFVVSPNSPVGQIWVSAHVQSFKLDWNAGRAAFVLAASGESLEDLIAGAIARRLPGFHL
jgi:iron donor protein CyaY